MIYAGSNATTKFELEYSEVYRQRFYSN